MVRIGYVACPTAGFCRSFSVHLLFVHAMGWVLDPSIGFVYHQVDILRYVKGMFRVFWGSRKTYSY